MEWQSYLVFDEDCQERTVLAELFYEDHSRSSFIQLLQEEMSRTYGPNIPGIRSFVYLGPASGHPDWRLAA